MGSHLPGRNELRKPTQDLDTHPIWELRFAEHAMRTKDPNALNQPKLHPIVPG